MSITFGILRKDGSPIEEQVVLDAMGALSFCNPDRSKIWIDGNVGFGNHLLETVPESKNEDLPFSNADASICINADARLNYREELVRLLNLPRKEFNDLPDSQLIFHAYQKWGERCVEKLNGDFSFSIFDKKKALLFCARDHFGCKPFYYYDSEEFFIYSSNIMGIKSAIGIPLKIKDQWIVDSLTFVSPDKNLTAYENIHRLPPAHFITISNLGQKIVKYWNLECSNKFSELSEDEAISKMKEKIKASINNCLRSKGDIGVELSGGIDSSGIAAVANALLKDKHKKLIAFSHSNSTGPSSHASKIEDETKFSKHVVKHLGIEKHIMIDGENSGLFETVEEYLKNNYFPCVQIYALVSDLLYQAVEAEKVQVLLSGFGGDEGITSRVPGFFTELAKQNRWRLIIRELESLPPHMRKPIWKSLLFIVTETYASFIFTIYGRLTQKSVRIKAKNRARSLDNRIKQETNAIKHIIQSERKCMSPDVRIRQIHSLSHNHIPIRLENSYYSSSRYRIEYRYPFLDRKLIEFYFNLPSTLKRNNGYSRYIYRKAMEDLLPQEICWRTDKSTYAVPNLVNRISLDTKKFKSLIYESKNENKFHFVNYDRVLEILEIVEKEGGGKGIGSTPVDLLNNSIVLLLQKWQREDKINIGMRCRN